MAKKPSSTTKIEMCRETLNKPLLSVRTHELKTLPNYFEQVWNGTKNFEVRKNDRGFQKGDKVILKEYDDSRYKSPPQFRYTGRKIEAIIGFVLSEYQKDGYVTFSLLNVEKCDT